MPQVWSLTDSRRKWCENTLILRLKYRALWKQQRKLTKEGLRDQTVQLCEGGHITEVVASSGKAEIMCFFLFFFKRKVIVLEIALFFVHIHVVCLYDVFQHHLVLTKEGCLKIIGSAEDKSTWGRQVRGQERYSHCSHNTNQLTKQINKDRTPIESTQLSR